MEKISNVKFSNDAHEISKAKKFVASDWSEILGTSFSNLIAEASSQVLDGDLSNRMSSALLEAETLLGTGLNEFINSEVYGQELDAKISEISSKDFQITRLDTSLIKLQAGDVEISLAGNFNGNIQSAINALVNHSAELENNPDYNNYQYRTQNSPWMSSSMPSSSSGAAFWGTLIPI